MKIFIIQSGNILSDKSLSYSITSNRQVESLILLGLNIQVGLVTSRSSILGALDNIKRLKKEVTEFKPDIIHSHYGSVVGIVANRVASSYKRPFIVSFCGDDLLGTPNKGLTWRLREFITKHISLYIAKKADGIVVKSENLLKALPVNLRNKASIIPNGVDETLFSPKQDSSLVADNGQKKSEEFVVFFNHSSGSNQDVKNPELAEATINELNKLGLKSRLNSVGGIEPEQFRRQLSQSDCLLVTSFHEGSPNVVKEAMAANVPVVSVDCGDVSIRLANVNKGGIFDYNEKDLAKAIFEVYKSDKEYNGREELIKQGLTESIVAKKLLHFYDKVIKNKVSIT